MELTRIKNKDFDREFQSFYSTAVMEIGFKMYKRQKLTHTKWDIRLLSDYFHDKKV